MIAITDKLVEYTECRLKIGHSERGSLADSKCLREGFAAHTAETDIPPQEPGADWDRTAGVQYKEEGEPSTVRRERRRGVAGNKLRAVEWESDISGQTTSLQAVGTRSSEVGKS
ncbi:MAG: hypothetical protein ACLP5H_33630, partial [Desulfomonilaceae bacterium]